MRGRIYLKKQKKMRIISMVNILHRPLERWETSSMHHDHGKPFKSLEGILKIHQF